MTITGELAIVLNLVTVGVLSFCLTVLVLSGVIPAVFHFIRNFTAQSRQKLLWVVVFSPWLSAVLAASVLVLPEFFFSASHWFTNRFHWHHSEAFEVVSWHGVVSFSALVFVFTTFIRFFRKAWLHSRYVEQLRYFSVANNNQEFILDTQDFHAFTAGWFTPKIYLSQNIEHVLLPSEYRMVCQHEAAHAKRFDPLRLFIFSLLAAFFPGTTARKLNQSMALTTEQIADQSAMSVVPDKFNAAQAVLNITRLFQGGNKDSIDTPSSLCSYTGSSLELRINYLINEGATPRFLSLITITFLMTLFVLSVTSVDWLHHSIELFLLH